MGQQRPIVAKVESARARENQARGRREGWSSEGEGENARSPRETLCKFNETSLTNDSLLYFSHEKRPATSARGILVIPREL